MRNGWRQTDYRIVLPLTKVALSKRTPKTSRRGASWKSLGLLKNVSPLREIARPQSRPLGNAGSLIQGSGESEAIVRLPVYQWGVLTSGTGTRRETLRASTSHPD